MFQDYRDFHWPTWDIKLTKNRAVEALGARAQELIEKGVLTGMCKVGFRLATVVDVARCLDEVVRFNDQTVTEPLASNAGTFANVREKARPLDAALVSVRGIGRTTALHIMTDLGYPLVKTDIWVCRFSSTFPSVRDAVLKNHRIDE